MLNCVEDFLIKTKIKNKPVIVGFSGGPDSCALALSLNELKEKYNLKIILAYFNHGWRKEADREEEFTLEFANKINAKSYIKKAPKGLKKSEDVARNARYEFFEQAAKAFDTDVVFLAHNKNDNVETLIYRIIKGTSIKGLTSIPPQRDIYFRPLLKIEKKEILSYLKNKNQNYMIDSSNDDTKYKRNLIRKKILPLFCEINENYMNNIDILIDNAISTKKILDDSISRLKKELITENGLDRAKFLNQTGEYAFEILNDYFKKYLKTRDFKTISKLYDFILNNENSKTSLNRDCFLYVKNNLIFIEKKAKINETTVVVNGVGEYCLGDFYLKIEKKDDKPETFSKTDEINRNLKLDFSKPYVLRHRRNGDVFAPFGMKKGKMKLKDYFINNKLTDAQKNAAILLCRENEVFWIMGMQISEKCRIDDDGYYKLTGGFKNGKND